MIATNPYSKVLLIDPTAIKSNTVIGSEVDDAVIRTAVVKVQNIDLQKVIGSALMRKLQELVKLGTISSATNYKVLLDEYIVPYLNALVVADIAFDLTYKLRNKGVIDSVGNNINSVPYSDIAKLTEKHKIIAGEYRNFLCTFLCSNSANYPELSACGSLLHSDITHEYECPFLL